LVLSGSGYNSIMTTCERDNKFSRILGSIFVSGFRKIYSIIWQLTEYTFRQIKLKYYIHRVSILRSGKRLISPLLLPDYI
jgi:hypothetical protein